MERKDYERFAKRNFSGKAKKIVFEQIENFYNLEKIKFRRKKYRLGEDVVLKNGKLMTGFAFNKEYLKLISEEGKICGDFASLKSGHGVKYAVSTWKFEKKIVLHDYVLNYSGMSVVWGNNYEMVPYGQLDDFVERMKLQDCFCWTAESTREMRFLPNLARKNNQVALIFDMAHKDCQLLLQNDLLSDEMPKKLKVEGSFARKEEQLMQDGFAKRVSYILFGIPRNCIEGIFVNRDIENNIEELNFIKKLFPDCYICNVDGKVVVE